MIRDAVLYLPAPGDARAALGTVAGRPVAFRSVMAAVRAGVRRVGIPAVLRTDALERAIAASPSARAAVAWLTESDSVPDGPILLLPATGIAPTPALVRIAASEPTSVLAESVGEHAPVVAADAELGRSLRTPIVTGAPLGDAIERVLKASEHHVIAGGTWYVRVASGESVGRAEARLYGDLASPIDTRLDTVFHRRLSQPVTRLAVAAGVGPNSITVASLVAGLAAVWALWQASVTSAAAALLLYAVSVVLDHSDGEVARLTLAESRVGEWLDVASDTLIHAGLVIAMGVTAAAASGRGAGLGAIAAVGIAASAWLAKLAPAPSAGRVGGLLAGLGNRDGFYAMLLTFILALAVAKTALPALMIVVAVGAHSYWLARVADLLAHRPR